jgi:ERCC4-type nuclease
MSIDPRKGSGFLAKHFPNAITDEELSSGDVMIISNTGCYVGVEIKTIGEMVSSMQGDKRFVGSQLTKMEHEYDHCRLAIHGFHKIHDDGMMEFFRRGKEHVNYMSFMNHLTSIENGRNIRLAPQLFWNTEQLVMYLRSLANWYSHQDKHKSHTGTYTGRTSLMRKPTRLQKVAAQFEGIEHKLSQRVAEHFSSIHQMINAPMDEWQKIDKIGKKKSQAIIDAIMEEQ